MTWIPLISAIAGGAIAIGGNLAIECWRQHRRAKSLAFALRGEIKAIIEVVGIRRYVQLLDRGITLVTETQQHSLWYLPAKNRYFMVYEENASDLGMLSPDVTESIARTYALAKSFLDDVTNPEWLNRKTSQEVIDAMQEARAVLIMALESGHHTISVIEAKYFPYLGWRALCLKPLAAWCGRSTRDHRSDS
ncbi:hypothetical protein ABRY94_11625 [Castellaniella ginsengisoli]|uniref:Uncharacterized protein n=1 Tax=Castellaniella ginsengisoli TaxID=546114 RepID=A0AB39EQU8_9BURK